MLYARTVGSSFRTAAFKTATLALHLTDFLWVSPAARVGIHNVQSAATERILKAIKGMLGVILSSLDRKYFSFFKKKYFQLWFKIELLMSAAHLEWGEGRGRQCTRERWDGMDLHLPPLSSTHLFFSTCLLFVFELNLWVSVFETC